MAKTNHPTEEQIREALWWLGDMVDDWHPARDALHLARRGAQRIAADECSTHDAACWQIHHECAIAVVEEAAKLLREYAQDPSNPAERNDRNRALLARIDPETETDDGSE